MQPTLFTKLSSIRINPQLPVRFTPRKMWLQHKSLQIKVPKIAGKFYPLDNFSLWKYGPGQIYFLLQSCNFCGKTRLVTRVGNWNFRIHLRIKLKVLVKSFLVLLLDWNWFLILNISIWYRIPTFCSFWSTFLFRNSPKSSVFPSLYI